ncbi:MAG: beta-ketoacyl-[acyl-carrier-protein] synthase family protein [Bacteroidetes bacterium]|nr:beta-ketoacyl-[acyl-carrier-protein] synthase family protein [Bacteroidota bacterium]
MLQKVAVTGMGIVSAIGNNVAENYTNLIAGNHGLTDIANLNTIHKGSIKVGEIKNTDKELKQELSIALKKPISRTSLLGIKALKEALTQANIKDINQIETAFISSSSVGGMDKTEHFYQTYFTDKEAQNYITTHDIGDTSHKIADYFGLKGMVTAISTACSSSANAIMLGVRLIQTNQAKRVIVGGTDALTKFTINGFNTLMILTDSYNTPFDENRKGLNLGEAAAYLILESEDTIQKTGNKPLAYISGYGNANDAYHQTASSEEGEGAYLAMKKAFEISGLKPQEIDYINTHGTATENNDLSEGKALERIYNGISVPHFSSTKPFTGHTLAAAAAIEAVFSILALQNGVVYPNLNFTIPMKELSIIPQTVQLKKNINHVLSNSFGFGGNCSSLIFSK